MNHISTYIRQGRRLACYTQQIPGHIFQITAVTALRVVKQMYTYLQGFVIVGVFVTQNICFV